MGWSSSGCSNASRIPPTVARSVVRPTAAAAERLEDFSELGHRRIRELLEQIQSPDDLVTIERAIDLLADAAGRAERNPS
jgi:hypothetical protein